MVESEGKETYSRNGEKTDGEEEEGQMKTYYCAAESWLLPKNYRNVKEKRIMEKPRRLFLSYQSEFMKRRNDEGLKYEKIFPERDGTDGDDQRREEEGESNWLCMASCEENLMEKRRKKAKKKAAIRVREEKGRGRRSSF